MGNPHVFNQLLVGLAQWSDKTGEQLPTPLVQACNALASRLMTQSPKTWHGWLTFFQKPVARWWPAGWQTPNCYDTSFSLLDGLHLSEEAGSYLNESLLQNAEITEKVDSMALSLALDNLAFKTLLNDLRAIYDNADTQQAQRVQSEYVQLRRFLIESPYTTTTAITSHFAATTYVKPQQVGDFYDYCTAGGQYIVCRHCGPLRLEGDEWRGLRPSVCDQHNALSVSTQSDSRQLRPGLIWRVCMPGLPELRLYDALLQIQANHPNRLTGLSLWPGLDAYDVQIRFSDGDVWAVDIKDYRHPHQMAQKVVGLPIADGLPHRIGFYVVPNHRVRYRPDYVARVQDEVSGTFAPSIINEASLLERVQNKLRVRSKPARS